MVQLPAAAAIEYVAAGHFFLWGLLAGGIFVRGCFCPGGLLPGGTFVRGLMPVPPKFNAYTNRLKNKQKNRQTRPRSSAGSRPPLPKFSEYVEVEAHYIFHPSTIWVRPLFTELGPKKTQKAYFAMKQTNICRLSGDIIIGLRMGIPLRYLPFQKNSSLDEMEK